MSRAKVKWLDMGNGPVRLPLTALCLSEAEFKAMLKRCGDLACEDDWCAPGGAIVHHFAGPTVRVALVCMDVPPGQHACSTAAMLVHEAVHIKQRYMRSIGEKEPSAEFEAYVVQWISQQLFLEFDRRMRQGEATA